MKSIYIFVITFICLSINVFSLHEQFNGNITDNWTIERQTISVQNGILKTSLRGTILSKKEYPAPKKIKLRVRSDSSVETFGVMVCTDGTIVNRFNSLKGLQVNYSTDYSNFMIIDRETEQHFAAIDGVNIPQGTWVNLEIEDLGTSIKATLDDGNKKYEIEADVSDYVRTGNKVALYSRELGGGSSVDYFKIEGSEEPVSEKPIFQLIEGNFTWDEAKADAELRGGRLAIIDTPEKNSEVMSLDGNWGQNRAAFIGLTDRDTEGQWKWIDGSPLTWSNWKGGEPNDAGGEDVAAIVKNEGWNDEWVERNGEFNRQPYILELTTETEPTLENGLVAYYPFNGNANDGSGNDNDGTVNGATLTSDRNGNNNSAYTFDGSSYIELPDGIYFDGPFTISGWVKISEHCNWCRLVDFSSENQQNHVSFSLSQNRSGQPRGDVSGNNNSILSDTSIPLNKWSQILWKYDGEFTEMFINGNKVAVEKWSNPPLAVNRTDNWIGRSNWENSPTKDERTRGLIDDIRIYDRALSASEVSELYELEKPLSAQPTFQVVEGNFTWEEAKADAEAKGGRLAVLNTQDKYDQMYTYLESIGTWPSSWVGMSDVEQEGVWKWITGEIVSNDNWRNGEPNGGSRQNYGRIGASSDGWGKGWDDIHSVKQSYILELTTETEPTLEDGLVAYYPFNGNASDESGNGLNGQAVGAISYSGGVADLTDSYIDLGQNENFLPKDKISISTLFKRNLTTEDIEIFVSNVSWTAYTIRLIDGRVGFRLGTPQGGLYPWVLSTDRVDDNDWHHLAVTWSGTEISLYIDGILNNTLTTSEGQVRFVSDENPTIGIFADKKSSPFSGMIDNFRIYNRALSSSEVSELYELEKPTLPDPSPPVVSFDEFYEALPDETITIDATPESGFPEDFTYQWYFGTFLIPEVLGGKSNTFNISSNEENNGVWTVKISNSAGSTESSFYFAAYKDTDGDGISDGREEYVIGSDPTLADTDGDGLKDYDEVYTYGTSFSKADTDGDGFDDIFEISTKYDPLSSESTPEAYLEIQTAVEIKFNAGKNLSYKIENSVDLENWSAIETGVVGEGKLVKRLYSIDDYKGRYFRVRREED